MATRRVFDFDTFAAGALLVAVLMLVLWGCLRQAAETEAAEVTRQRLQALDRAARQDSELKSPRQLAEKGRVPAECIQDGWGRELTCDPELRAWVSLGADGLRGGSGFAADIVWPVPTAAHP